MEHYRAQLKGFRGYLDVVNGVISGLLIDDKNTHLIIRGKKNKRESAFLTCHIDRGWTSEQWLYCICDFQGPKCEALGSRYDEINGFFYDLKTDESTILEIQPTDDGADKVAYERERYREIYMSLPVGIRKILENDNLALLNILYQP